MLSLKCNHYLIITTTTTITVIFIIIIITTVGDFTKIAKNYAYFLRVNYGLELSTVALHCCKAHERINRKTGNSTPCKIVTTENFTSKVCTRDYVACANFCGNLFIGGFSPTR